MPPIPDQRPNAPWAKLQRDPAGAVTHWHGLVAHSCDVAAVLGAILRLPTIAARLETLAGCPLDDVAQARLCGLAFLHDIGKANRGFQARIDKRAPPVGHIDPVSWLFRNPDADELFARLSAALDLDAIEAWLPPGSLGLIEAVFAHHGAPWCRDAPDARRYWRCQETSVLDADPFAHLGPVAAALRRHHPAAFGGGQPLSAAPAFHHAFAGLLMLADWLGSDQSFFPLLDGAEPSPEDSRAAARRAVAAVGLDPAATRAALRTGTFQTAFGYSPRGLQAHVAEPTARCVVLEAETGSGKTEAALWRFRTLFEQGAVDGLYFALPTRVAATAMFARVKAFRGKVFGAAGPAVVLAVPGQAMVDEAEGRPLPDFGFEWTDHPDGEVARQRWAAEHPKRFLAAPIAVGTIDQALLGAIRVKHSQMRGAALLRHLLVVDEVHASDPYMSVLLGALLRNHGQAGGHALLLSATLGAAARAELLGTPCPPAAEAEALDYPALSFNGGGQERHIFLPPLPQHSKTVLLEPAPIIDQPDNIAARALSAAGAGAKVLVIRNTVRAAIATLQAIERADPNHPALFRVNGVVTPHHSRYGRADRRAMDDAVETTLGRESSAGGRIVVGTQTLEISLDLDADVLISDLCPADVLLQRIGRLHRHRRDRPPDFTSAAAIILVPGSRDLVRFVSSRGARPAGRHGLGFVYEDLRTIEATWRLIEADPSWIIPAQNRRLVERSTHPDHLSLIERDLVRADPAWLDHVHRHSGQELARIGDARSARLDWSTPFEDLVVPVDERIATRLGAKDRQVDLPDKLRSAFGNPVRGLKIPHYMVPDVPPEAESTHATQYDGGIGFRLGEVEFLYDRLGLRREEPTGE